MSEKSIAADLLRTIRTSMVIGLEMTLIELLLIIFTLKQQIQYLKIDFLNNKTESEF